MVPGDIRTGDAVQAEGFHRRALRAREVIHGPDHPDMPLLLSNLAGTLYVQVTLPGDESVGTVERFQIMKGARVPVLTSIFPALGSPYQCLGLATQGKDDEAEPLHERALQLREALLGSTHPDVATSLEFLVRMAMRRGM